MLSSHLLASEQPLDELKDIIQPDGVSLWHLVLAAVIAMVAFPISRFIDRLVQRAARRMPNISPEIVTMIGRGSRYLTLFVLGSWAISLLGVEIGWAVIIAIVTLFLMVMIARPLIENAAAGMLLQARPTFALGDEIAVSGYSGTVMDINARTTALKTRDGYQVHIPNKEVLGEDLVVLTAYDSRRAAVDVRVDSRADLERVTRLLTDAISDIESVLPDPAPVVMARSFGDGFINLSVRFWFGPDTRTDVPVTDRAIRVIQLTLNKAGVDMPTPQMRISTTQAGIDDSRSNGVADD
jgi:small-conductance mechanosensitive channel